MSHAVDSKLKVSVQESINNFNTLMANRINPDVDSISQNVAALADLMPKVVTALHGLTNAIQQHNSSGLLFGSETIRDKLDVHKQTHSPNPDAPAKQ